jgi:hypothetical protein
MIVPSWLLECAISRPNQALVAAAEGAGQGGRPKISIDTFRTKTLPQNLAVRLRVI